MFFDRIADVRIGLPDGVGRSWSDIRIEFEVEKSLKKDPNTASISLYNLDPVSVGLIQSTGAVVMLRAGYQGVPSLLFDGTIPAKGGVTIERNGTERVVTIEAGDGELQYTESRFDHNFAALTPNTTIFAALLASFGGLGLAPGDPLPPYVYQSSQTFSGPSRDALEQICRDVHCSWSIQDGNIQILIQNIGGRKDVAPLISSETGLIGSPKPTKEGCDFDSLLNASIKPGGFVSIVSRDITGFFKVLRVKHHGDTHGAAWTSSVESKRAVI